jgi:hypothetical protein
VFVTMMKIRVVRVAMAKGTVHVPVAVRLTISLAGGMAMLMMFVMPVQVVVPA